MTWKYETPIEGGPGGCACCGYQYEHLPMNAVIAVGFGAANLMKDDELVYDEQFCSEDDQLWTVRDAEEAAAVDPDHDWRIHLFAPLSERHYQRQGEGLWVLYEKGEGFA